MKKKILSFLLMCTLLLCGTLNVEAKENNVEIKNVSIEEKSDNVDSTVLGYESLDFNIDLSFYNLNDYITYKILLKNNTDEDYIIDTITDSIDNDYVTSVYTTSNDEFKAGEEIELYVTFKYNKLIDTKAKNLNQEFSIKLNYKNGNSTTINANPSTNDNIKTYIFIGLIALGVFIAIIIRRNKIKKMKNIGLMILLLLVIPTVSAATMSINLKLNLNLMLYNSNGIDNILEDTVAPDEYTPSVDATSHSITVSGATVDNKTSEANLKYYYSIDEGANYTDDEGTTYTFEDLVQNKNYHIIIKVVDEAENERIIKVDGKTISVPTYDVSNVELNRKKVIASNIDSEYELLFKVGDGDFEKYTNPIEFDDYEKFAITFKYVDIKGQDGNETVYEDAVKRRIYLEKPNEWATPYAYLTGDIANAWPGVELVHESGNLYYFEVTDEMLPDDKDENSLNFTIQFNNGGSNTNTNNSYKYKLKKVDFEGFDKVYVITSGSTTTNESSSGYWKDYEEKNVIGRIYFNVPVSWDYPHAYLFNDSDYKLLGAWPGIELTQEEDYIYYFEITEDMLDDADDITNYKVTFNNGGTNYNQSNDEYKYKSSDIEIIGYDKIYNLTSNLNTTDGDSTGEWLDYSDDIKIGKIPTTDTKPKNVIIMIGDGMGENHIKASEIDQGKQLNIQTITNKTYVTTESTKSITDSSAAATAMATGYKTINNTLGKDKYGNDVENILTYANDKGLKTGMVVTQLITHATPAGFSAHNTYRYNYDDIAQEQIQTDIDIMLGGGSTYFDKYTSLIESNNVAYIHALSDINNIDSDKRIIGTFATGTMSETSGNRLSLTEMTSAALPRLENEDGFILMIEGSDIDLYSHRTNMSQMLIEMKDFDDAVGYMMNYVDEHPDTLLIITADHETGGLVLDNVTSKEQLTDSLFTNIVTKNNKTEGGHTDKFVELYAYGMGASDLTQYDLIDNTSIYQFVKQIITE